MSAYLMILETATVVSYSIGSERDPRGYCVVSIAREEKAVPFEVRSLRTVMASRDSSQ